MAHFAKLDENNFVVDVQVIGNRDIGEPEKSFPETEPVGQAFIASLGFSGVWKQTSYNKNFRKNYAFIGGKYDSNLDAFINPQPYPSWTLNTGTCQWEPPIEIPKDNKVYLWNENTQSWDLQG